MTKIITIGCNYQVNIYTKYDKNHNLAFKLHKWGLEQNENY